MFRKYMHLERIGNDTVSGIQVGKTYVFPKLDGANGSIWYHKESDHIHAGSRNRQLTLEHDNAGFYNYVLKQDMFKEFFKTHPNYTLYGEWLVPHSLKTYREDAWRKFYVFDVYCNATGVYLHYDDWKDTVNAHGLDWVPCIATVVNGTPDIYLKYMDENTFLIEQGQGVGEGIVIKNYDWVDKYGNVTWAKMITNKFKEAHTREMGAVNHVNNFVEQDIVEKYVTLHLVDKTHAKIKLMHDGWESKYIPQLLNTVWHDLITEELWDILKKFKNPTLNFQLMQKMTILKIKELRSDLF